MTPLAASLMFVFVAAKVILLAGRPLPVSAWAPFVYVWQDVAVVLVFLVFERVVRRRWAAHIVYGALVLLVAINLPVARVLSSPLTAPMLRAARGALADSIRHYVTAANLAGIAVVLVLGVAMPFVARRYWRPGLHPGRASGTVGVAVALAGAAGASRVDTAGLERDPLLAIVQTTFPRVRAMPGSDDWRASPLGGDTTEDLSSLRAVAAGRNVLVIVLESTGAGYLRAYGAREDPTPNLSALATRSIVFENTYAVYPESIKGLVAVLASRYPGFDVSAERHAPAMAHSLATELRSAGYATALFHSGRFMYLGMDAVLSRAGFGLTEDAGGIGGNRESSFGIDESSTVRRMLGWIDTRPRGRPFFIAYLPVAGHHPYSYTPPQPFADSTDSGRYLNALHEGDAALGALVAGLRTRGLDRSTLIVVLGDHGEAFGQHAGNFGHTLALYDENVRVPLLVAAPGALDTAVRINRVASLLDVAPTILDLLGRAPPAAFEGESLLAGRARMALFFSDYSLGLLGLRDGCTKYIHELESGRSRMFDLCNDPGERVDLTPRFSGRAARYRERLRAWSAAEVARIGG